MHFQIYDTEQFVKFPFVPQSKHIDTRIACEKKKKEKTEMMGLPVKRGAKAHLVVQILGTLSVTQITLTLTVSRESRSWNVPPSSA